MPWLISSRCRHNDNWHKKVTPTSWSIAVNYTLPTQIDMMVVNVLTSIMSGDRGWWNVLTVIEFSVTLIEVRKNKQSVNLPYCHLCTIACILNVEQGYSCFVFINLSKVLLLKYILCSFKVASPAAEVWSHKSITPFYPHVWQKYQLKTILIVVLAVC